MEHPKVGDIFYWKDMNENIHEEKCFKIENDGEPNVEAMYFTHVNPNGGGVFVTSNVIISSNSPEVQEYKQKKVKEKVKEIEDYFSNPEVYSIVLGKLCNHAFTKNESIKILNVLKNMTKEDELEFIPSQNRPKMVSLDKVCDYLKKLAYQEYPGGPLERMISDEYLEELRKEMEEMNYEVQ